MTTLRNKLPFGLLVIGACTVSACATAPVETVPAPTVVPPTEPPAPQEGGAAFGWSSPPAMEIDPSKTYEAVFMTEAGDFRVRLFAEQAPVTVNNFVFLAKQGYYNDTTFHRVLPGFMAQGGDPTGTGAGGPGYTFEDEFHPDLEFDRPGLLAMANRGPNTNGGQFFITYVPTPHLDGLHTIFGEVIDGAEVVNGLTPRDPLANPDYMGDGLISVVIIELDG